jgi:peptidoglycan hydrolase-like protein with peptidoglycan-binding domain
MTLVLDRDLSFRFPLLSGEDVRAVQQALIRAGALRAEADGVFGPLTRDAVATLQRRAGLAADGTLRRGTWDRLLPAAPPAPRPAPDWREMLRPFLPRLCVLHGPPVGQGARRWRLTPTGIVLDGSETPHRTADPPRTASLAWDRFRAPMQAAAARFGVPVELLLATACTESGGRADAVREEPGYISDEATPQRVSPGLMQTLIGTAREALGDPSIDRARLLDPALSLLAGAALIRRQAISGPYPTAFDPPLVSIAYNAGSLRESSAAADCPWGLVQTRRDARHWHADSFIAFLNDSFAVLADDPPDAATPAFATILSETS